MRAVAERGYADRIVMTLEELRQWLEQHLDDPCSCGQPGAQIDHKKPLARGGLHSADNLQMLCGVCNAVKGAALPTDAPGDWVRFKRITTQGG